MDDDGWAFFFFWDQIAIADTSSLHDQPATVAAAAAHDDYDDDNDDDDDDGGRKEVGVEGGPKVSKETNSRD